MINIRSNFDGDFDDCLKSYQIVQPSKIDKILFVSLTREFFPLSELHQNSLVLNAPLPRTNYNSLVRSNCCVIILSINDRNPELNTLPYIKYNIKHILIIINTINHSTKMQCLHHGRHQY